MPGRSGARGGPRQPSPVTPVTVPGTMWPGAVQAASPAARATAATAAGVHLMPAMMRDREVGRQARGHISTIQQIYTHVDEAARREALTRLNKEELDD